MQWLRSIGFVGLVGCAVGFTTGCGTTGALGGATVAEGCTEEARCFREGLDQPLAQGATIRPAITTKLAGNGGLALHVESADDAVLKAEGGRVTGVAPGVAGLLLRTDAGTVVDFLHVSVKAPTAIELASFKPDGLHTTPIAGRVELLPGESLRLVASLSGEGQPLAGEAPAEWKLDPPIGMLLEEGTPSERRLVASEPGSAKLTVRALDQVRTLDIVVRDARAKGGAS